MNKEQLLQTIKDWFFSKTGDQLTFIHSQAIEAMIEQSFKSGHTINLICISPSVHHETEIITNTCECEYCLNDSLKRALENEDYEQAATLRDKIKNLKDGDTIQ